MWALNQALAVSTPLDKLYTVCWLLCSLIAGSLDSTVILYTVEVAVEDFKNKIYSGIPMY